MENTLISQVTIIIKAPISTVWKALTTPEIIKEWLFGTNVETNWQVGSPIIYTGEWEGKKYEEKGIILQLIPEKILSNTYWSGMSGLPDEPENYQIVTYKLSNTDEGAFLTITQEKIKSAEDLKHSEQNWTMALQSLKSHLENLK